VRRLLKLLLAFCLIAGPMAGSVVHAMEMAGGQEVTETTHWLHAEGDADQVPPDADKDYPHHHNVCHGHELAAPLKACDTSAVLGRGLAPTPVPDHVLGSVPLRRTLRPPIA